MARIGILKEQLKDERRVAVVPDTVQKLIQLGFEVRVQSGAGLYCDFSDEDYKKAGAVILASSQEVWDAANIVVKIMAPSFDELKYASEGQYFISLIAPAQNPQLLEFMAQKKITVIALDAVPRISRAQKLDVLSSMANVAGYRAVVEAAHHFGRFFTGQVTAAGKIPPAKVFIIGAGVSGLAAIGAASALGAIVRATDTRPEVVDQIKSMGGEYVEVPFKEDGSGAGGYAKVMSEGFQKAQKEMTAKQCKEVDVVITTALIPGKPAPKLITEEMLLSMKPGSVIVDLAGSQGGNCEWTVPGQVVVKNGITIIGYTDLPSRLSRQSSLLLSQNIFRWFEELCPAKNGQITLKWEDPVHRGATVIKEGQITWPPPASAIAVSAATNTVQSSAAVTAVKKHGGGSHGSKSTGKYAPPLVALATLGVFLLIIGAFAPASFVTHFTVFMLSCFIGYMVVWNVTASLHTPLMSVTNAISSVIVIGALLQVSSSSLITSIMAIIAVALCAVNMVGGFSVTNRMLNMFRK